MDSVRSPISKNRLFKFVRALALIAIGMATRGAFADQDETGSADRQSLDDAWWTGPLVAAGGGTHHQKVGPYPPKEP